MDKNTLIRVIIYILIAGYIILAGYITILFPCEILGPGATQCPYDQGNEMLQKDLNNEYADRGIYFGTGSFTPVNGYRIENFYRIIGAPFLKIWHEIF